VSSQAELGNEEEEMPVRKLSSLVCCLALIGFGTIEPSFTQETGQLAKGAKSVHRKFLPQFTISKETTWATEPVGPSGCIDYLAVINRKFSPGVTSENNAVVSLYQALGPSPDARRQPDQFFALLGIDPIPDEGVYFEDVSHWWRRIHLADAERGPQLANQTQIMVRPWTAKEFPEIDEWLMAMEQPLARVMDASERSEYYSPFVTKGGRDGKMIAVLLPGVQMARSLARALLARAMLHLGNKDRSRAWTDILTVHRLARLVGRGPTLIEGLVGVALEQMAIEAELRFLTESHPNAKFLARYRKQLEELPPRSSMADKLDISERICFLDCCQQLLSRRMRIAEIAGNNGQAEYWQDKVLEVAFVQLVDWDDVMKSGNRYYDRLAAAARLPKCLERERMLLGLGREVDKFNPDISLLTMLDLVADRAKMTQYTTDRLFSLLIPGVLQSVRAETRCAQRFRNLQIAMSLAAWICDHRTYPATLDDLVPKYLAELPQDLFAEQSLHYQRTANGYLLYSVGANGIDDKGLTYGERANADDLRVEVPVLAH